MRELHRSDHFVITLDEATRVVRRTRTGRAFASLAEVEAAYDAAIRATESLDRRRYGLLIDVRLAPPRNDPEYEQIVERLAQRLYGAYPRVAILARTEVGRLQVRRMTERNHSNARAFVDEAAALAYLREISPSSAR